MSRTIPVLLSFVAGGAERRVRYGARVHAGAGVVVRGASGPAACGAGWVGAVLVVVVTWVVRVRLPAGGGDAGRPGSVSILWRTVGLVAASVAAAVAVVVVLADFARAQSRRRDREHKEQ